QQRALRAMRSRLRDAPETWADAEILANAALRSRWLLFDRGLVSLLCPPREAAEDGVVAAAARLARSGWRDDTVLGSFISHLVDATVPQQPLLRMMNRRECRPFDVVWAAAARTDAELDLALRREFDRWYEETRRVA